MRQHMKQLYQRGAWRTGSARFAGAQVAPMQDTCISVAQRVYAEAPYDDTHGKKRLMMKDAELTDAEMVTCKNVLGAIQ